jgi:dUTP pyrophosphatase
MRLKIKRNHPKAKMPFYAHEGDAGMDLMSVEEKVIRPGDIALIATGLTIELPPQTEAQVRPRSGLALKHGITLVNTPGTIDQGYRGEIKVIMINHGKEDFLVEQGMRIAQMVIQPVLRVAIVEVSDELSGTERGTGGFGSSGMES